MRKLFSKIKTLVVMAIINFILFTSNVYAESADPLKNPNYYKPNDLTNAGQVKTIGNTIIGGIQFIGTFISVIVLIIIGIRFIYGSAEERAEYERLFLQQFWPGLPREIRNKVRVLVCKAHYHRHYPFGAINAPATYQRAMADVHAALPTRAGKRDEKIKN